MGKNTVQTHLTVDGANDVTAGVNQVSQSVGRMASETQSAGGRMSQSFKDMAAAFTAGNLIAKGIEMVIGMLDRLKAKVNDSALYAASVETIGVAMNVVGNNAGYSAGQMATYEQQVKKMGITTEASRQVLTQTASAQMDVAKTAQLARVAQDAGVIGVINSSEALKRMVQGIRSGEVEILKTIGINVNFEQSYKTAADSLGITTAALTEQQKVLARQNAVLEYGVNISGVYEASMTTTGKLVTSLTRWYDELKLSFGEAFAPALGVLIESTTEKLKGLLNWFTDNRGAIAEFAQNMASITSSALHPIDAIKRGWKSAWSDNAYDESATSDKNAEAMALKAENERDKVVQEQVRMDKMRLAHEAQARLDAQRLADAAAEKELSQYNSFVVAFNDKIRAIEQSDPTLTKYEQQLQKLREEQEKMIEAYPKEAAEIAKLYAWIQAETKARQENAEIMAREGRDDNADNWAKMYAAAAKSMDEFNKQQTEYSRLAIQNQLSEIDVQEKFYALTAGQAAEKRIALLQESLELETAAYQAAENDKLLQEQLLTKINATNAALLEQQKILKDSTAWGAAISALKEYGRMATDIGAQTKSVITDFMTRLEVSLTKFIRTGKLNFTDLINSMLDQMARVTVQQGFTGPLSNWLGGVMNNYGGGSYGVLANNANSYGVMPSNGNGADATGWGGGSWYGAAGSAGYSYLSGAGAGAAGSSYGVLASDAGYSGFGTGSWFGGGASSGATTGTSSAAGGMSATGYGLILMGIVGSIQSMVSMFEGSNKRWDNLNTREKVGYWQNVALQGLDGLTGGKVFGGKVSSHAGIELGVTNGEGSGGIWSKTTSSGGWFSGGKTSKTFESFDSAWGGFVHEQMTSIKKALTEGTAVMSQDSGVVDALMSSFSMATKRIDMKDMNTEEQQQAIADYYRAVSNAAIDKLYTVQSTTNGIGIDVNTLDQYRQVGEDSTATFARLSASATLVNDLFSTLGITLNEVSLAGAAASDTLIQALGGMDQAQQAISNYYKSGLFSDSEQQMMQLASAQLTVNDTFGELNLAVPKNNLEYRELVKNYLAMGDSGAQTAAELMNVANAFGQLTSFARTAADAMKQIQGGGLSILSPSDQYFASKSNFASATDAEALSMVNDFLTRSRAFNGSGQAYVADYTTAMTRLGSIASGAVTPGTSYLLPGQDSAAIVSNLQAGVAETQAQTRALIAGFTELITVNKSMDKRLESLENGSLLAVNA